MNCRAGADWVVGAEVNQSMCDIGAETLVMNGFGAACMMVNKDVRHMSVSAKPDGTPPDMQFKADLAIFEVCSVTVPLCYQDDLKTSACRLVIW